MSQFGAPALPAFAPQMQMQMPMMYGGGGNGSEYGGPMPFQHTGGSMYAPAGSMYGVPMPMMAQHTGSAYGMPPPSMLGMGTLDGSQAGGMGMGGGARPMSTFSMATTANMFSGPNQSTNPTDEELVNALRLYLGTQDLMTVTKK
jgi:chitin synthase